MTKKFSSVVAGAETGSHVSAPAPQFCFSTSPSIRASCTARPQNTKREVDGSAGRRSTRRTLPKAEEAAEVGPPYIKPPSRGGVSDSCGVEWPKLQPLPALLPYIIER